MSPEEDSGRGSLYVELGLREGTVGGVGPPPGLHMRKPRIPGHLPQKPVRVREVPAYPPQSVFWPGLTIRPPPAAASARRRSTSSIERTLWASAKPGKPLPSAGTPASAARSSRGKSESQVFPISKNETTPGGEGSCGSRRTSL